MHHIFTIAPPWVEVVCNVGESFSETLVNECPPSFVLARIPGDKCESDQDLFAEFSSALKFPTYFGKNWNAFEECIRDLEWSPAKGYVIEITRAEQLLTANESDYGIFIDIIEKTGKEWATRQLGEWPREPIPFHVLMTTILHESKLTRNWLVPVSSFS
jgi:RNAse (barnase) inhibitor barstar